MPCKKSVKRRKRKQNQKPSKLSRMRCYLAAYAPSYPSVWKISLKQDTDFLTQEQKHDLCFLFFGFWKREHSVDIIEFFNEWKAMLLAIEEKKARTSPNNYVTLMKQALDTQHSTEPVNAFPLKPIQCFSDCSMCPCGGANHFINGEPLIPCCCTNFNGFNDKTRRENLNQERGFASRPADLKQAESGLYRLKWMLPQQGRQKEMAALAECNKKVGKRTKRLVKNPKTVFEKSGSEELEEPILKQLQQQDFEACLSSTAPIFIWSDDGKALCKNNLGLSVAPHNCFSEITAHSVMPTKTTRKHLEILFPKSFGVKSGIQTASNGGSVIDKVEPNEFFENAFDGSVPNSTETSTTPLAPVPSMHSSQLDEELETGHAQIIETFSVPSSNPDTLSLLAGEPDGDVYAEKDSVLEQYDSSNASRSPGLKHHRHKIGPNNQPGWAAAFRSTPKPQRTEEQIELLCYQFKPSKLTSTCLDVHTPFDVTPPKYVGEKFHVHKTDQDGIDQKTVKTRTTSSSPSTDVNIKPKGIRKTRKHLKKLSIF